MLDFIRTLLDESVDGVEELVIKNMEHFSKFLLHEYPEVREICLEIASIVTDSNNDYRLIVAKNSRFINR